MKKKVVIVTYEILEWGGIVRVTDGYQTGFKKLGYEVVTYIANKNGHLHVDENEHTLQTKWFRPKAINLGWNNKAQLAEYMQHVKESDFVLMMHGCPHPTKSGAKGDFGWQRLYKIPKKLGIPTGIMFTDNLWDRSYKWILDVIDRNTHLFHINWNAGFDSIEKLPYESTFIDYPMDFDEKLPKVNHRKIDVAWIPQIKRWKGIYELIDQLSYYPNAFYTVIFNTGIEYYNMRNGETWAKAIREERRPRTGDARNTPDYYESIIYNPKSTTDYFGLLYPSQVNQIYANSKVCIDLSGAYAKRFEAQFTCAMLEPMVNGSVVAGSPRLNDDRRSRVEGLGVVHSVDPNALIDSIEEIVNDEKKRKQIAKRAYRWAHQNCRDDMVSLKLAEYMRR